MIMKFAVIDIGSNSVRLMLWADGKSIYKKVATTRLGEGIALSPVLRADAMERTANAVAAFAQEGRDLGAQVVAFATAAVRSAENGDAFCALVKEKCGVTVDVVSGEEEAHLGLNGALGKEEGGIVDIGGASTEIAYRQGGTSFFTSLPIGAVRLFDLCKDDKAALCAAIGREIPALDRISLAGAVYAIGGTASTLACVRVGASRYDGARLQDLPLTREWVRETAENLLAMTREEREAVAGMDVRRADIIAGASLWLASLMEALRLDRVLFSDRDNLEGYLVQRGLI